MPSCATAPTIAQRKAALRRLRSAILAQRGADGGRQRGLRHRSPYETDITRSRSPCRRSIICCAT